MLSRLKQNWIAATCLACAAVTLAYVYFWQTAAMPQDGQSIVYPFTIAYNYSALPVSIVVLLGALTAFFFWLPTAIVKRGPYVRDGWLVALAVLALVASVWLALPLGRLIYRELAQTQLNGTAYYLGVRVSPDPTLNAYVLCEGNWITDCRYLQDESLKTLEPLPTLTVAGGRLRVEVAGRILYEAP